MNYNPIFTPHFLRRIKELSKKYRSLRLDLEQFTNELLKDPTQGVELSPGIRKIRMAISSKGRGKSGGARVITFTLLVSENDSEIYFVDIYDKSEYSTVDISIIRKMIDDLLE